jgi:NTE family protein
MQISIALGGGGSKGMAHMGVLRCLENEGFEIQALAGTSAGGIVGALYAAGYTPDVIIERFTQVDQSNLYARQSGDGPSLLGVAGLNQVFDEMLGDRTFEDLMIPLGLTAVDMKTGQEVVIKRGRVVDAILASMALPGIFPPREWEGHYLVDGGLLDPVPIEPARSLAPELPVVAVVLSPVEYQMTDADNPPAYLTKSPLLRQIARLRVTQAFNIFVYSTDIGHRYIAEMRLKLEKPDVIIRPDLADIGLLDRVDIVDLAQRGESAAREALPELRQALNFKNKLIRRLRTAMSR